MVDRLVYIKGLYSIGDGKSRRCTKKGVFSWDKRKISWKYRLQGPWAIRSLACVWYTFLNSKPFTTSSTHVPLIRLNDFAGNFSVFLFRVFSFRAVLYLPDHKAYTSTVYRPHCSISSLGIILKKLAAGFANVCTGQRMICNVEKMGSFYLYIVLSWIEAWKVVKCKTCWPCWNANSSS